MRALLLSAALVAPLPAAAQDEGGSSGMTLMQRGAELFFEGFMSEVEPAIDDLANLLADLGPGLQEMVEQMGPAFADLMERVDDLSNYEAPEMLPNGDIIIRRKPEAPTLPETGGPVEL
ncbi:MAG: hypothetical protein ACU0CO_10800 [Shimia sp.]